MVKLRFVFLLWCYVWALYGPDVPAMATPSAPSATAKTPTKRVHIRLCFICGSNVATTATYYKVDQETARRRDNRRNLGSRFSVALDVEDIVDFAFQSGLGAVDHHLYVCNACCVKLDTLESAAQTKKNMVAAFTGTCHRVQFDQSIQRQKRLPMDSPSTTGYKKPSKRATAATASRPMAKPRPPRSLFADISNANDSTSMTGANPASENQPPPAPVNVPGHAGTRQTFAPKARKHGQEHEKQQSSTSVSATVPLPVLPLPPQLDPSEISDVQVRVRISFCSFGTLK